MNKILYWTSFIIFLILIIWIGQYLGIIKLPEKEDTTREKEITCIRLAIIADNPENLSENFRNCMGDQNDPLGLFE